MYLLWARREFLRKAVSVGASPFLLDGMKSETIGASLQEEGLSEAARRAQQQNEGYFSDPVLRLIWRNWDLVEASEIAAALETDTAAVTAIGEAMGLSLPDRERLRRFRHRNQFAIIKRNWEHLPNSQLSRLVGMTEEEIASFLRQDIAFLHIVGPKPDCEPVRMSDVDSRELSWIRETLIRHEPSPSSESEPSFAFIDRLSSRDFDLLRDPQASPGLGELDLSQGWRIVGPVQQEILETALSEFTRFCRQAMDAVVVQSSENEAEEGGRTIRIQLRPEDDSSAESFQIRTDWSEIIVSASSPRGAMRGLQHLQKMMRTRKGPFIPSSLEREFSPALSPRIIFPYFARYGDVLGDPHFGHYYPEGFLSRLSRMGFSAIWLAGVLRDLVGSQLLPGFGRGDDERVKRLRNLVSLAGKYGLDVYLYLNEPRGMPAGYFEGRSGIRGAAGREGDGEFALCTSTSVVQKHLVDSVRRLAELVPGLGGLILITASENLTNCYSLSRNTSCPRCRKREPAEVVAEVVGLIKRGVQESGSAAEVIVWDWSWTIVEDDPQEKLIAGLPPEVTLMVDFERGTPIARDGFEHTINEYSLSVPGPSPRAAEHLRMGRQRSFKTMAKIQLSTTWECGAMPFIPVLNLLAEKLVALHKHKVEGAMQSWTLGSCPSVNTELADLFNWSANEDPQGWFETLAVSRYGEDAASEVLESWKLFSEAFADYPFSNPIVYSSQVLWGPAHPLYFHESHRRPSLQNSRDSLDWTRPYGPEATSQQFRRLERRWNAGVIRFQSAFGKASRSRDPDVQRDIDVARAFGLHMGSVANQIDFLLARRVFRDGEQGLANRVEALKTMKTIVENEQSNAAQLLAICMKDSRIGFEAFFQYVYRPQDIREKILSCEYLLQRLIPVEEERLSSH